MYQIAFSVTDYRYRPNAANATLPMGVYVNSKAFDQTQTLLELNERALRILENYFQIAYALPKLDQIVIDVYGKSRKEFNNFLVPNTVDPLLILIQAGAVGD